MQRGRNCAVGFIIETLDLESIDHIDFLFKQTKDEDCQIKVTKTWPSDYVEYEDNIFYTIWTPEDTRVFAADETLWLDTRPVDIYGNLIETLMVPLRMNGTLFKVGE